MSKKLHPLPLLLQLPLPSNQLHPKLLENNNSSNETSNLSLEEKTFSLDSGLIGLIDIISLEKLLFNDSKAGEIISKTSLLNNKTNEASLSTQDSNSNVILKETLKARNMLIETLANHDDELLEILLEKESTENYIEIGPDVLKRVIRRLSLKGVILPVFLGSAAKNVGIQPLLDGVRDYLPSPIERDEGYVKGRIDRSEDIKDQVEGSGNRKKKNKTKDKNKKDEESSSTSSDLSISKSQEISIHLQNQSLVALAFKVIYDKRKGPLTFIRIYSGTLKSSDVLFNTNLGKKEKFTKILLPYADQYLEVEELKAGKIGVLIGLKDCMTGDTLIDSNFNRFDSKHLDSLKMETEEGKEEISKFNPKTLKLREINIPPPVFSISIEPLSKSDELPVLEALEMLIRTDPSLRLDDGSGSGSGNGSGLGNAGTGQMILSGMGELHLEISKDRLKDEFGVRARIGKVRVSFRESIGEEIEFHSIDKFKSYSEVLEKIQSQGIEKWSGSELLGKEVAGKKMKAGIEIEIRPLIQNEEALFDDLERNGKTSGIDLLRVGGNLIEIDLNELENDSESSSPIEEVEDSNTNASNHSISSIRSSFISGLTASLSRGPLSSSPITNLYIKLSKPKLFGNELSSLKSLNMVSNLALRNLIKNSNPKMMEPVMKVTLRINKSNLGKVVGDLTGYQDGVIDEVLHSSVDQNVDSSRDSPNEIVYFPPEIQSSSTSRSGSDSNEGNEQTIIKATVPLSNLVGYSTRLRALTGGTGNFEMEFKGFKRVSKDRQFDILKGLGRA